jgi:hypothetical protein
LKAITLRGQVGMSQVGTGRVVSGQATAQPASPPQAVGYPAVGHPVAGHQHPHPQGPVYVLAPAPPTDPVSRLLIRVWGRVPVWATPLSVLVCFLGGVGYVLATNPTDAGATSSPTCLVRLTTGFDCPGCGGTRAFWYLVHGNVPAAARSHLIAVFAAPFLVYAYVVWVADVAFRRKLPPLRVTPKGISLFLAAWGVFTVLRNLPWAPFTWFFV